MRRFRPYFRYLRTVRGPVAAAIGFGLLYGAASGAGMPLLLNRVFPRIFSETEPRMTISQVALIAAGIPVIFLIRALSGYANSYFTQLAGVRILEAIREAGGLALLAHPARYRLPHARLIAAAADIQKSGHKDFKKPEEK